MKYDITSCSPQQKCVKLLRVEHVGYNGYRKGGAGKKSMGHQNIFNMRNCFFFLVSFVRPYPPLLCCNVSCSHRNVLAPSSFIRLGQAGRKQVQRSPAHVLLPCLRRRGSVWTPLRPASPDACLAATRLGAFWGLQPRHGPV